MPVIKSYSQNRSLLRFIIITEDATCVTTLESSLFSNFTNDQKYVSQVREKFEVSKHIINKASEKALALQKEHIFAYDDDKPILYHHNSRRKRKDCHIYM